MSENKELVRLAVDAYKGKIEKYSMKESQEALRAALIELNGGSSVLDIRKIRDGQCPGLFTLIEEILSVATIEELNDSDFFNSFVDTRNMAEGDKNIFVIEDSDVFEVATIADGTQAIRRQRIGGRSEKSISTQMHAVRIYEELNRILSGKVDFNDMINKVTVSYKKKILSDIYAAWNAITAQDLGGNVYFPVAGAYDEDALLDLIAHVEAATGMSAKIVGTKKAARVLAPSIMPEVAKEELYKNGYYGSFFGTPVMLTEQRHKLNSTQFMFPDDMLTIVAGADKPIKFVYEGNPLIIPGNPLDNADLTQEYFYGSKYGVGIVVASGNCGIGRYEFT